MRRLLLLTVFLLWELVLRRSFRGRARTLKPDLISASGRGRRARLLAPLRVGWHTWNKHKSTYKTTAQDLPRPLIRAAKTTSHQPPARLGTSAAARVHVHVEATHGSDARPRRHLRDGRAY